MANRQNRWVNAQMELLRQQFGGKCSRCGSTNQLEFAHLKPTGLDGKGRGKQRRVSDIRRHPDHYTLLCRPCHIDFDTRQEKQQV